MKLLLGWGVLQVFTSWPPTLTVNVNRKQGRLGGQTNVNG